MDNGELLIAIKDMFEKKTSEIKSYVDNKINEQSVLIENLRGDVKAVAEGHDALDRKIDSLDKKVNSLDKKVESLDIKFNVIDKKLDDRTNELKNELRIVAEYVIGVDAKLNEHALVLKRVK